MRQVDGRERGRPRWGVTALTCGGTVVSPESRRGSIVTAQRGRARSPHTQLRIGEAYEAGRGVPRDLKRAEEWYGRAAAAANRQAQEALARLEG